VADVNGHRPEPPTVVDLAVLSRDVAEACADALLIACGQALVCRGLPPEPDLVRGTAIACLDEVLARTLEEGPKPRE